MILPDVSASSGPVAIVDIGSNSVRLVVFESLSRAPILIYNEKSMCGLGKGVFDTGRLGQEPMARALSALRRFRIVIENLAVSEVRVVATAAARVTSNGEEFIAKASEAIGGTIHILSGAREAQLSALGVISGFHRPDGVAGDMGGGSLELIDIRAGQLGNGLTLPLGSLALIDASKASFRAASKIVEEMLEHAEPLQYLEGRQFYAVGGTWRSLAKLHMEQKNYPLHIMHGYTIPVDEALAFVSMLETTSQDNPEIAAHVSSGRRPFLVYGAIVLDEIIRRARPKEIVISASGVREGLLYESLSFQEQQLDPFLLAAWRLNNERSRSPAHAKDLCQWTDLFMESSGFEESLEERRLRHGACMLADIGWRTHPDYRGLQILNIISHSAFMGLDHPSRAFLALASAYRHSNSDIDGTASIRAMVSPRLLRRARILGGCLRLAYCISAAMPDILPRVPLVCSRAHLTLTFPEDLRDLAGERIEARIKKLGKLLERSPKVKIGMHSTKMETSGFV